MIILSPVAQMQKAAVRKRPVLASLAGKRVGFVEVAFAKADIYMDTVRRILVEKYGVEPGPYYKKGENHVSEPLPEAVVEEWSKCDAIVSAFAH